MRVVIKRKHTLNSDYFSTCDCPLARAIKEQHPEFPNFSVGGDYIRVYGKEFEFQSYYKVVWNSLHFRDLKNNKINEVILDFPVPEYDNQNREKSSIKEIIRYVSVPQSINEQIKNLILS